MPKKYTNVFKRSVVRYAIEHPTKTLQMIAVELQLPISTLRSWLQDINWRCSSQLTDKQIIQLLEKEIKYLRCDLARQKQEIEMLKEYQRTGGPVDIRFVEHRTVM